MVGGLAVLPLRKIFKFALKTSTAAALYRIQPNKCTMDSAGHVLLFAEIGLHSELY